LRLRGRCESEIRVAVDQSWINGHSRAIYDSSVGRNLDAFANVSDQAIAKDNRAFGDRLSGTCDYLRVFDRERVGRIKSSYARVCEREQCTGYKRKRHACAPEARPSREEQTHWARIKCLCHLGGLLQVG
jgi:hypothetical protein